MAELTFQASVFVARPPAELYAMVADVTRMGEWSPICRACWWDDGTGPTVGAWFTGRNSTPERTWETRSQVVVADPGREFTFEVGEGWVRWRYTFPAVPAGTRLTQTWTFLAAGIAGFHDRYGDQADAQITDRTKAAHTGIPVTLAAIKAAAEA